MPTKIAVQEAVSEWSSIFPSKIDTRNESCIFMKKLFAIGLSNILYLRHILPDRAFRDKVVDGLLLKILQNEVDFPPAARLITWARGCFDALEKNYLKTVIIGIHSNPDDLETAIESYSFRFTYSESGNSATSTPAGMKISAETKNGQKADLMKKCATENIKSTTLSLLRTLLLASRTMGKLPPNVSITMKLLYFDEITPPEYEPPGFRAADFSSYRYVSETMSLLVGNVDTGHHNMELRLKTDKETFEKQMSTLENHPRNEACPQANANDMEKSDSSGDSHKIPTSVNLTGLDNDDEIDVRNEESRSGGAYAPLEMPTPNESTVATPGCTMKKKDSSGDHSTTLADAHISQGDDNYEIQCPCKFFGDDGIMIICDNCRLWQHSLCYGIIAEEDAPQSHICVSCAIENPDLLKDGNTDMSLLNLTEDERMKTCVYRRLLMLCRQVGSEVSMTQVEVSRQLGVDISVCQDLTAQLQREGIFVGVGKRSRSTRKSNRHSEWKVNRERLEHQIPAAFGQNESVSFTSSRQVKSRSRNGGVDTQATDHDYTNDQQQKKVASKRSSNRKVVPSNVKKIKASVSSTPQMSI